jgi:2-oxoisovalerate dehydrogenase E1 component beta subunit
MPSTPLDAYGLMLSAIEDSNPVLFLKPKALLRVKGDDLIPGEPSDEKDLKARIDAPIGERTSWKPKWPKLEHFAVPIGKAKILKQGDHVTVVSWGRHVLICAKTAAELEQQGISVEVIDLRSLYPYDWSSIRDSVRKTRKVLFVNEDTEVTNFAEHLAFRVTQELFYELDAPPRVIAGKNLPGIGLHPNLEDASVPQAHEIKTAIEELAVEKP